MGEQRQHSLSPLEKMIQKGNGGTIDKWDVKIKKTKGRCSQMGAGLRKEETGPTCFSVPEPADVPQRPSGKQRTACRSWLSSSTVGFSDQTRVIGLAQ